MATCSEFVTLLRKPRLSLYLSIHPSIYLSLSLYIYIYIYIYICIHICVYIHLYIIHLSKPRLQAGDLRPISLLRSSLLRLLDSNFPGNSPMELGIPPLRVKITLESSPLKSRSLVRRLAVPPVIMIVVVILVIGAVPATAGWGSGGPIREAQVI